MADEVPFLSAKALERFKMISSQSAQSAAEAFSALVNQRIDMSMLRVTAIPLEKVPETIGTPEERVTTVMMEVEGEGSGYIVVIYPEQAAFNTVDLMQNRPIGTTTHLTSTDNSALTESGNIITGAFLTSFSDYLKINLLESVPDLATDMLQATIDVILAKFLEKTQEEAIAFEIDYQMSTSAETAESIVPECKVNASFLLLITHSSAAKLIERLEEGEGGE
jgi:chemotaxis protein CheC